MLITENQNTQKVIVGLGLTGLSCAKYLAQQDEDFLVIDSRENPPGLDELLKLFPDIKVELGDFSETTLMNADELIVSPGVDLRTPAIQKSIENGVKVTGDIDIFAKQVKAPIVAVTGSNAKSTVVSLLGDMAERAGTEVSVAGNIGTPVLDLLREKTRALYILELSSFQLETTNGLGAEVATVLNMSFDHMDRYDSMQEYHRAKHKIFQGCRQVVVNRDDSLSQPLVPDSVKQWSFGLSEPDIDEFGLRHYEGELYLSYHRQRLLAVRELKIAGKHNIANALAALALGHVLGLGFEDMIISLKEFKGLPHRCQWIGEWKGVNFYNDSKGTNVGACIAAIEGLSSQGRILLIAGGIGKGADFSLLAEPMLGHGRLAIVYGEDADAIAEALVASISVINTSSLQAAVRIASEQAEAGDVVLLSPACASFDMFDDYRHRGEVFVNAVKELH